LSTEKVAGTGSRDGREQCLWKNATDPPSLPLILSELPYLLFIKILFYFLEQFKKMDTLGPSSQLGFVAGCTP
jgi:hypothetical protein